MGWARDPLPSRAPLLRKRGSLAGIKDHCPLSTETQSQYGARADCKSVQGQLGREVGGKLDLAQPPKGCELPTARPNVAWLTLIPQQVYRMRLEGTGVGHLV